MKIQNVNGTWWNADNDCWTEAACAASEYEKASDLPMFCGDAAIERFSDDDIRYYDDADADAVARVQI